jgi:hypothetical protein
MKITIFLLLFAFISDPIIGQVFKSDHISIQGPNDRDYTSIEGSFMVELNVDVVKLSLSGEDECEVSIKLPEDHTPGGIIFVKDRHWCDQDVWWLSFHPSLDSMFINKKGTVNLAVENEYNLTRFM